MFAQITQAEEKPVDIWNIDEKTKAANEILLYKLITITEDNQENISNLYKNSKIKKKINL